MGISPRSSQNDSRQSRRSIYNGPKCNTPTLSASLVTSPNSPLLTTRSTLSCVPKSSNTFPRDRSQRPVPNLRASRAATCLWVYRSGRTLESDARHAQLVVPTIHRGAMSTVSTKSACCRCAPRFPWWLAPSLESRAKAPTPFQRFSWTWRATLTEPMARTNLASCAARLWLFRPAAHCFRRYARRPRSSRDVSPTLCTSRAHTGCTSCFASVELAQPLPIQGIPHGESQPYNSFAHCCWQ